MQGAERDVLLDGVQHRLIDNDRFGELGAAVQHAMADRADFVHRFDDAVILIGQGVQHVTAGLDVRFHGDFERKFLAARFLGELAAVDADALDQALGERRFVRHINKLVFQRG